MEAFVASDIVGESNCLLLDVTMPEMAGPDPQQELKRQRQEVPIGFTTRARRRIGPSVLTRGRRAVECLFNPFSEAALLDALDAALRVRWA